MLGAKLTNRCRSVFNASQLLLIDGVSDGQKGKSCHFESYLLAAGIPELTEIEKLRFNKVLPKIFEAVLLIGEKRLRDESYITGLGGQDYQNIPELGIELAITDKKGANAVIRTVYGATEMMPLRGLSYLLPGLVYMENMQDAGIKPPQFQVIFANNISSRLDSLDLQRTREQVQRFTIIAREYVQSYFSKLAESVVFLQDTPLEKGSVIRSELISVAATLRDMAGSDLDNSLKIKGKNNGAARTYAFYGAAHSLFHDADLEGSLEPLLSNQSPAVHPNIIISLGGYQEQLFYKLRHALKPHLGPTYNTIRTLQLFTKNRVPPYYMARGGDISLDDALKGRISSEVAVAANYDIDYLRKVSMARGEDITKFIQKQGRLL